MASVTIDSGQFPLMRNIDMAHQPSRSKVYAGWVRAFTYAVPEAIDRLADVIEDVYTYKLWEERRYSGPEEFLREFGITGLNLDDPAKLLRELRKKDSPVKRNLLKRIEESKRLVLDENLSLREAAKRLGVDHVTVRNDLLKKDVLYSKVQHPKRNPNARTLNLSKDCSRAASQIREKFGDEFADALGNYLTAAGRPPAPL